MSIPACGRPDGFFAAQNDTNPVMKKLLILFLASALSAFAADGGISNVRRPGRQDPGHGRVTGGIESPCKL